MADITPEYARETPGPMLVAVSWPLFVVSATMVSARLYIRARWLRNIGLEDYIIAVSLLILAAFTIVYTVAVSMGYGRHAEVLLEEIGMDSLTEIMLLDIIASLLGIIAFTLPKLAIAILLQRILNPGRLQRLCLWTLISLLLLTCCVVVIMLFTACDPVEAQWTPDLVPTDATHCLPQIVSVSISTFYGALAAFTDLYLAIYPVVVLATLKITLKKKLALCAVLGLGIVACCMAVVKCLQLPRIYDRGDAPHAMVYLALWTSIEANTVMIASCIPTLGPLYDILTCKRTWSAHRRYYQNGGNEVHPESHHREIHRPKRESFRNQHLFTTNFDDKRMGSQESILALDDTPVELHPPNRIHRTDQVIIKYEMRPMGGQPSW
ncbi:hypothetical protein BJX99DRAFT_250517 [Aspergillus californicus]